MSKHFLLGFVIVSIFSSLVYGAPTGQIAGKVTDKATDTPLAGANVTLQGTSMGDATDLEGEYRIKNVPPGEYTLVVTYIGYEENTVPVRVQVGKTINADVQLVYKVVEGEEVEITAQAEGQAAAINQQLRAKTIVNVVSKARIRELPDDNVAESVGRLPGVAVRRSAGEGSRVNIRGMSPKFNSVKIDGQRIPATGQGRRLFYYKGGGGGSASTLTEDRSVDLSVISSEAVGGIEIYKALTPEQDADAIGGSVNFVTSKAREGFHGRVNVIPGYTGYHDSFENIKANATVSNRFFNNNLGVLFSGAVQRADRSRDVQQVNWILRGAALQLSNVDLDDALEKRDRYNFNLNFDYEWGNHSEFKFSNMYSRTDREVINRSFNLSLIGNDGSYSSNWSKPTIYVYSSNLSGDHHLSFADIDWGINYITTVDENDFNYGYGFNQPGVFQSLDFVEEEGPYAASNNATVDLDAWGGSPWGGGKSRRDDDNWSAQLNLQREYSLGSNLSGNVKTGAKYRAKDRSFDQEGLKGRGSVFLKRYIEDHPDLTVVHGNELAMSNFLGAYEPGNFFYGDHPFPITLDYEKPREMFKEYRNIWKEQVADGLNDYTAKESITAGYFQTEINYKQRLTFLGGARYEHVDNKYTAIKRTDIAEDYFDDSKNEITGFFEDTTATRQYGEWFPQFHLKYSILQDKFSNKGLDVRLAYTKSISRPDFLMVSPRYHKSDQKTAIERGRTDLKPTTAWNYDIFLTGYSNLGMLTIGGFYKDLDNVVFLYARKARPSDNVPDRYQIVDPQNSNKDNKVWGYEIEFQPNMTWLPSPFDGIVFYGNYSSINSEVYYPWTYYEWDPETFTQTKIDSTRKNKLPGQADNLVNVSLGYEKGPFSARFSYYFQDETLEWIGENELIDGWVDEYARLDFSATYNITRNFTVILNLNNINNRHDRTYIGVDKKTGSESVYGMRGELGLRYTF